MELRYLRYFVAVASARHFTRAAETLGISQPPLSQQIQKLEQEIGTPLLRRLTRGVELTNAGKVFYEDACHILTLTDEAIKRAKSIARGETGKLRVGFASSTAFQPIVLQLLHAYRDKYPEVILSPSEETMPVLMNDLHNGHIDVAFIRQPCDASNDFTCKVLVEEDMLLVLPHNHPLHRLPKINLQTLQHEKLIIFPREVGPGLYDAIITACYRAGFQPELGQQSPQMVSAIGMVSAGFGFTLVPRSLTTIQANNVTYHEIDDSLLKTKITLAWRRHEHSAAVLNMVNIITRKKLSAG
ncbi:TPA: LysR family transcriptional regulator [Yersinia enterocolitica]|uniref:LysR substrate-binding domain-containing protein n=1 Tax=Yersinia enterocolitica TaxID=630 RepID=UPI00094B9128|nr:LysR substrate-binding domain-containing protein [Yersinia enterocolitica]MBW5834985.1 LysR family transcriptional regulator [Yersinia enterocolitica]MBX9474814.1 LysR family transcriptional regulator [Yersinia enterocolitica]MBX9487568.1 LysR family transcriptional regulator [Yersinia enterocolitica]MBX9491012.1 LysR family transcriptional regulator [Yersinia enterocolitica]HDL8054880.1 LysR family transcriptional regulator [Yersinia enterocolitica]